MKKEVNGLFVELRKFIPGQVELVVFGQDRLDVVTMRFNVADLAIAKAAASGCVEVISAYSDMGSDVSEGLVALEIAFKPYWPKD